MAKLEQGILGGIRGKIGNVIGSSWKGIAVVKSKPLSVANPRTAGQIAQRTKLTNVVEIAKPLLTGIIKPLWDRFAQRESGYNAFVKTNIDLFDVLRPDPREDFVISQGKMSATAIATVVATNASADVTVTWVDDSGEGFKLATDEVYVVVHNWTQGRFGVSSASATRADETVTVTLSTLAVTSDSLDVYLAFRRADGTVVSNTAYKLDTV